MIIRSRPLQNFSFDPEVLQHTLNVLDDLAVDVDTLTLGSNNVYFMTDSTRQAMIDKIVIISVLLHEGAQ